MNLGVYGGGVTVSRKHSVKGKGKGHPTKGDESPEEEYRYCSNLCLTSVLDGGILLMNYL